MAERQSSHRQDIEKSRIEATNRTEHLGQILAALIAMATIIGGIYLISIDKDVWGLVAIVAPLVSLTGVFIYGKHSQAKEREEKLQHLISKADDPQLPLFDQK